VISTIVKTQATLPQSILVADMASKSNAYVNRRQAILPIARIFGHPSEQNGGSAAKRRKIENYEEASSYLQRRRDAVLRRPPPPQMISNCSGRHAFFN
jgi:hypothetical protein